MTQVPRSSAVLARTMPISMDKHRLSLEQFSSVNSLSDNSATAGANAFQAVEDKNGVPCRICPIGSAISGGGSVRADPT